MVIIGTCPGRIATEEDLSAVQSESIVDGVENLRRNEVSREEDICTTKRALPRRHRERLFTLSPTLAFSVAGCVALACNLFEQMLGGREKTE